MSRFTVANGMEDEVRQAFRDRPHLVDDAPGFVRMEVLSPVDDPPASTTRRTSSSAWRPTTCATRWTSS